MLELQIADLFCVCCAEDLEQRLKADPRLQHVHVDYQSQTLHAAFADGDNSAERLRNIVRAAGYHCADDRDHHAAAGPRLAHAVAMAPITLGTTQEKMQFSYQALHAAHGHDGHTAPATAMPHPADHESHAAHAAPSERVVDPHAHHGAALSTPGAAAAMEREMRLRFFVALALSIPTFLYSPVAVNLLGLELPGPANWIMLVTATPIVFWCGWMFIGGAYYALKHRALNMNVLVATGVLAAWGFSVGLTIFSDGETFFEAAALLVTFVLFGHWMEMRSRRGTTAALQALFDLAPPTAIVVRDGADLEVPTSAVVAGDIVRLRPGSRVPVDGVVLDGSSHVDESLVSGESRPVAKAAGDIVIGGSVNGSGSLLMQATRVGPDTTLAQIVALVERAQASKAPAQRLADRAASWLVVLAVGSGIVTFVIWLSIGDASVITALTFAVATVVIACPDALGLATPTAIAVGTGIGARHSILIKDAATLERLATVDTVVLDKTGTLTVGRPSVTDVLPQPGWDTRTLTSLVAAAERDSEHPLGAAIVRYAEASEITPPAATAFASVAGEGITASVSGHRVVAGNARILEREGVDPAPLHEHVATLSARGQTPVLVAIDGVPAGVFGIADTPRPTAAQAVASLRDLGIRPLMLTGDVRSTAETVAQELGVTDVIAEVAPSHKADEVRALQSSGRRVAMVGDGVNDAPALATADVGIAIGAGTDVAVETAGVVLMQSDPLDVVHAISLARATLRKMRQNLFWASIYNVLAIPVAAGVLYPNWGIHLRPEWAALLM
ncbi:MAG: ATPase P, partial [Chloroflexi bacterium]